MAADDPKGSFSSSSCSRYWSSNCWRCKSSFVGFVLEEAAASMIFLSVSLPRNAAEGDIPELVICGLTVPSLSSHVLPSVVLDAPMGTDCSELSCDSRLDWLRLGVACIASLGGSRRWVASDIDRIINSLGIVENDSQPRLSVFERTASPYSTDSPERRAVSCTGLPKMRPDVPSCALLATCSTGGRGTLSIRGLTGGRENCICVIDTSAGSGSGIDVGEVE